MKKGKLDLERFKKEVLDYKQKKCNESTGIYERNRRTDELIVEHELELVEIELNYSGKKQLSNLLHLSRRELAGNCLIFLCRNEIQEAFIKDIKVKLEDLLLNKLRTVETIKIINYGQEKDRYNR